MAFKIASRMRGLSDEAFREDFGAEKRCRYERLGGSELAGDDHLQEVRAASASDVGRLGVSPACAQSASSTC